MLSNLLIQLLNGLASASSLFLVSAGLSLIFGVTRIVNFAHGSLYMLGAYVAWSLIGEIGGGPAGYWTAVLAAAITIGVIGVLLEMALLRRIYGAPELLQLIATFGVVLIVKDVALSIWGAEDLLGPRAPGLKGAVEVAGRAVPQYDLFLIVLGPLVLALLWFLLRRTRWGVLVRAATQDREMTDALGVNQARLFSSVFFLGSVLAGLGGALQLPREPANLAMDLTVISDVFVVTVVGGLGSIPGAFLAATLIGVIKALCIAAGDQSILGLTVSFSRLTLVAEFIVMAVVLVFRPWGLLGRAPSTPYVAGEQRELLVRPGRRLAFASLAVLALLVALPWLRDEYTLVLMTDIAVFALFAASLHFLMGPGGMASFGHAVYFGLGAYAAALLARGSLPMEAALFNRSRNLWQKAIEMLWATRFEVTHSKKEILQLYAAHAPFGGNVVGLGAASWRYYHKTPDQLSWGEAAALAVLPNAPGMIHPGRNRDAFLQKRNKLIHELERKGIIDATEASLALQEPLPGEPLPLPDLAPHVLGHYATAGTTMHSTLDFTLQERLTELVQRHSDILSLNGVNNAALLVMETETGNVVAYVGNVSHDGKAHQNDVDIIQSERSSGSILKPFLFCAALQQGLITPQGIVEDIPTYIRGYQPLNFTKQYQGMVPADQALAMSLNVPMVRLLQQYGILPFKEKLIEAGITTLHYSPDYYGLPLVLGGAEVKLWDICGAYASMGRVLAHAYKYDHQYSIDDVHEPVLFEFEWQRKHSLRQTEESEWQRKHSLRQTGVWDMGAIWSTFEAMSSLRRPDQEGQWETFQSSKRIAWKTGTSFGFRDAWAVGVTPKYTIGVWIGNADGEGRPGVIGLHAAAPVMFDVLRMLDSHDEWWSPPYDALKPFIVCKQSGWLAGPMCVETDTAYFVPGEITPEVCSFHEQVYTDANHEYRYDPACMPQQAVFENYFIVPTIAESYYKRYHPGYRMLPPLHPDCEPNDDHGKDMAIIYPRPGSKIYIPYEWDKKKSKAVFSAVHRSESADVYWHLDQQFIGKTHEFHQIEIDPKPGKHTLVLQDEFGGMASTTFEVLNTPANSH